MRLVAVKLAARVTAIVLLGSAGSLAAQSGTPGEAPGGEAPGETPGDAPDWSQDAERVFACQQIADPAEKLACFEREVATLETAVRGREVLVLDREDVSEARRGLFGFNLPDIPLFGGGDDDEDEDEREQDGGNSAAREDIDRLEARLVRASETATGRWVIQLDTGARWQQIDNTPVLREPRPDDIVVIRKAALGSYMASIGGARAFRVRRVE